MIVEAPTPVMLNTPATDRPDRGRSALVVDDDQMIGRALVRILSQAGHIADHADNGLTAWEKLSMDLERFQLVITDFEMPEINGLELVQLLKEAGYRGAIIVYCSPLSLRTNQEFRRLGVTAILEKPCAIEMILRAVQA